MEQKLTLTLESFRACEAAEGPAPGWAGEQGVRSLMGWGSGGPAPGWAGGAGRLLWDGLGEWGALLQDGLVEQGACSRMGLGEQGSCSLMARSGAPAPGRQGERGTCSRWVGGAGRLLQDGPERGAWLQDGAGGAGGLLWEGWGEQGSCSLDGLGERGSCSGMGWGSRGACSRMGWGKGVLLWDGQGNGAPAPVWAGGVGRLLQDGLGSGAPAPGWARECGVSGCSGMGQGSGDGLRPVLMVWTPPPGEVQTPRTSHQRACLGNQQDIRGPQLGPPEFSGQGAADALLEKVCAAGFPGSSESVGSARALSCGSGWAALGRSSQRLHAFPIE